MSNKLNVFFNINLFKTVVVSSFLSLGLVVTGTVYAQLPSAQYYGNTEYITGGFGLDESTAIKEAMPKYSLVFTFASSDKGRAAYVSRVQVVVRDQNDATVLNVESQGPFVLAQVPAGSYNVFATYKNKTQSRSVTVSNNASARLVFDWPYEHDTPEPELQAEPDTQTYDHVIPGLGVNPRQFQQ